MKNTGFRKNIVAAAMAACLAGLALSTVQGATNIDPAHPYAYGANAGWVNFRGDTANGAVIGQLYCTGYVWSANCGWIGLGNGPINGWHYSNASAGDWGVNHDGAGNLSGYAYGANIGWVTFEQTYGQPRIDLLTGNLSGFAWGANIGWISLANSGAFVRTEALAPGPDIDHDGIPDAWEMAHAGDLVTLGGGGDDWDLDGSPDVDEYGADTNPLDDAEQLKIVSLDVLGTTNRVAWTSRPTRLYQLEGVGALDGGLWADVGGGLLVPPPGSTATNDVEGVIAPSQFYRVRAIRPLSE